MGGSKFMVGFPAHSHSRTIQNGNSRLIVSRDNPSVIFWTSRGHRCRPFPTPVRAFIFIAHTGFSIPSARRFSSKVANPRCRAFRKINFYARKSPYEYALGESRTHEIAVVPLLIGEVPGILRSLYIRNKNPACAISTRTSHTCPFKAKYSTILRKL